MCTVFMKPRAKSGDDAESRIIVGKNYDVLAPCRGMIFTNSRGLAKYALLEPPETPAKWAAEYGSVTFSQAGKEFPSCGMNEAGLIVEQTTLWNTVYPDRDDRPAVKELQWIQYMLDTSASVGEVIDATKRIRVAQEAARIQYFVADRAGNTALISYILGKEEILTGESVPWPVMTNDMYGTCLDFLHIHSGFGGSRPIDPESTESLDRFARTVRALDVGKTQKKENTDEAFTILKTSVSADTQWQIVYDPENARIEYSTKTNPETRAIDLRTLSFDARRVSLCKDIDAGGIEPMVPYSGEINRKLIDFFFSTGILAKGKKFPERLLLALAEYPETFSKAT
jgi:penicillin V acylase-like amidase (Ntn superfamily)